MKEINEKDRDILSLLEKDSKVTIQQISIKTGLPITTIHNRIKKMEENGIIKGYTVVIDGKKLGIGIKAYILINVEYVLPNGGKISQTELAKKINKNPLVDETNILAGGVDIIIKIHSKDIDELNDFIIEDLRNMDGIKNTQTMIVLSEI